MALEELKPEYEKFHIALVELRKLSESIKINIEENSILKDSNSLNLFKSIQVKIMKEIDSTILMLRTSSLSNTHSVIPKLQNLFESLKSELTKSISISETENNKYNTKMISKLIEKIDNVIKSIPQEEKKNITINPSSDLRL